MREFTVIVADPPWRFSDRLPGKGRGAAKHYPCLTVEDLCRFPLPPLKDDATLLLWRVASMQQEALDVCRMWGFKVKAEIVWNKRTPTGKRWFGMGRQVRMSHETCLIATRGKGAIVYNRSVRSTFDAAVGEHSSKPEAFFDLVESLYVGPYVELFARRHRPGWTNLGLEVDGRLKSVEGRAA